jgi:serine protease Do
MSADMNNKDNKGFSFIQEQIASKKRGRIKRMLFSFAWTVVLASVFGAVAALVFCISGPTINKMIGKNDEKKTVEFPTTTPDDIVEDTDDIGNNGVGTPTDGNNVAGNIDEDNQPDKGGNEGTTDQKPEPVIIEKRVNGNIDDLNSMFADVKDISNQLNKSLVTIIGITSETDWLENEYDLPTTTTGLVVANNGAELLVLVSYDRIKEAKNIHVVLSDMTQVNGSLQSYDLDLNLAIVAVKLEQISSEQLGYIQIAPLGESYVVTPGMPVLALGAPNGYVGSYGFGFVSSKLSGIYITDNKIDIFHTDIDTNENSEGIIVDLKGNIIGIITRTLKDNDNSGVTTVIGISKIKKIIASLSNDTERIYFGIKGIDIPESILEQFEIAGGIYVTEVKTSSPALEGGIQIGDVIISINDTSVMTVQAFNNMISLNGPKDSLKVKVLRTSKSTNKEMELTVVLGKKIG